MGIFDSLHDVSEKAIDSGSAYTRLSKKYYRLKTFKILAKSTSTATKIAVIGGFSILGFIFLIVSGTLWMALTFNNFPLAFLITALFLFLIAIVAFLLRKSIDRKIIRSISESFFDN